jgi:hypothetical protein
MRHDRPVAMTFVILGLLLIALAIAAYRLDGGVGPTTMVPSVVGAAVLAAALAARRGRSKVRWNVVAALAALVGAMASLRGLLQLPAVLAGTPVQRPLAVGVQSATAFLCIAFLVPLIARMSTRRLPSGPRIDPK